MRTPLPLILLGLASMGASAQDQCSTAVAVGIGTYTVPAVDGTEVPTPICAPNGVGATHGEWYSYTAPADATITLSTDLANVNADTRVHIYTGTCGALMCFAGDDDSGAGNQSVVTFVVAANSTYLIAFDDRWDEAGFDFQISEAVAPPTPAITFTTQNIQTSGWGTAIVDMDGDLLDDVVSAGASAVTIGYQQEDGTLLPTMIPINAQNEPSWSLAAGDLNNDGWTDLLFGDGYGASLMLFMDGAGFAEIPSTQYIFSQRTNMVDINNDGNLDAFVCHDVQPNCYFLNNANGTFSMFQGGLGDTPDGGNYGSIWVDYDNDHDMDLFIAKCRGAASLASVDQLHRNNGDGTYTEIASTMPVLSDYHQSWSSAWGDFDHDRDMDVMIGASSFSGGGHKVLRNDNGTFVNVTPGSGYDTYMGTSNEWTTHDFDNDGHLDILGGYGMMMGEGNMVFHPSYVTSIGNGAVGDVNNDGFLDILQYGTLRINNGNENNYLKVHATGTVSNQSGIGARIEISSPLGPQIREIRSGDGFEFMSSLTAHFGLGPDTQVDTVRVYWPSGIVDVVTDVDANTTLNVIEGELPTSIAETAAPELGLYPNPATDLLTLRTEEPLSNRTITVLDASGKRVLTTILRNNQIDVSALGSGVYVVQVECKGRLLNRIFTKY